MVMNQIYAIVNSITKQAYGSTAISVVDTSSLVSLGDYVFSNNNNTEQWYKAMLDRIALTIISDRAYNKKSRVLRVASSDWGGVVQKLRIKTSDAVSNPTFYDPSTDNQPNPFDVGSTITVAQKLFATRGTWSHEEALPSAEQLRTAFTNEGTMNRLLSAIYTAIDNRIKKEIEGTESLAVNTLIAGVAKAGRAPQYRNILAEYNTAHAGATLTTSNMLESKDFLLFLARESAKTKKFMEDLATTYNDEAFENHTPSEYLVVDMLTDVAEAIKYNAMSEVFHNDLVTLPNFNEVNYWQGKGTGDTYAERASIKVKNASIASGADVELSNVLACFRDIEACGVNFDRLRMASQPNLRADVVNAYFKADRGYYADMSENCIVFYASDATTHGDVTSKAKK